MSPELGLGTGGCGCVKARCTRMCVVAVCCSVAKFVARHPSPDIAELLEVLSDGEEDGWTAILGCLAVRTGDVSMEDWVYSA